MAPQKMRPTRYAHFEGHTDICYTEDGRYIVTCGSDGEVRVFEGLDDDDFKTHVVAECATAVVCLGKRILVGTDNNLIQAITLDEGTSDGIITRFTAPPTHLAVSKDGACVAGGASDMTIRLHDPVHYRDRVLTGHKAPILSVALDPKGEYLASSSCDGTVKIWQLGTTSVVCASWNLVPNSNSFSASPTLCRMAWLPSGAAVCVPTGSAVHLYSRDDWQLMYQLMDEAMTATLSIVTASPCGKFLAASSTKGDIVVWDTTSRGTVATEKHPKGLNISGLTWNPNGKSEIAFVDINGQFGTVENVIGVDYKPDVQAKENSTALAVFSPLTPEHQENGRATNQTDDEDDNEYSIAKIKSQLGFADDGEGTFLGLPGGLHDEDSHSSATQPAASATAAPPQSQSLKLPVPQRPFQPGMSPEHLTDRYMVWNNIGIVRQYNTPDSEANEDDGSIEVEFHDISVHHALHFGNPSSFTMAALSSQALILASEAREDVPSKLSVHHFDAWGGGGSNKEWHLDLTPGEEAVGLAAGSGFVALATDQHTLRLFSVAGVQREVLCAAGKVVCVAAYQDLLMVVCHSGMGVSGEQSMSVQVLRVGGGGGGKDRHPVPFPSPLPLSPRSYLAWAGFTDEGTPLTMDSAGIVRMMHYSYGYTWTVVLDSKLHTRGKSDHYFLIGASERQSNVRCILCKGSRFPSVLPKPHVSILSMKIPLCEAETEKGGLEEECIRGSLLLHSLSNNTQDEEDKHRAERSVKEAMIKLFALACRGDLDARALDVCRLMPSHHTVGLAIKYAAKLRKLHLAEKLGEVAAAKMEEEERERELGGEDLHRYSRWDTNMHPNGYADVSVSQEEEMEEEDIEEEEERDQLRRQDNPLLMAAARRRGDINNPSTSLLLSPASKNPFRRSTTPSTNTKKGIDVIDRFRKSQKKSDASPVLRPVVRKPQNRQQQHLSFNKHKASQNEEESTTQTSLESSVQATGKENQLSGLSVTMTQETQDSNNSRLLEPDPTTSTSTRKPASALHLWLQDHREDVLKRYPGAAAGGESDVLAKAAMMFKDVDGDVKQKYKSLAASLTATAETDKKRKLEDEEELLPDLKKKPQNNNSSASGISKLAGFKFSKAL